jgi:L,D-transpeptidase YbiS
MIIVSIPEQKLYYINKSGGISKIYTVSTAKNGTGSEEGSYKTPLGLHNVVEMYGHECREKSVFVGRRFTGEIYNPDLAAANPSRDWILTRIIRLSGLEPDLNLGPGIDTYDRYIYIHGCPDTEPMGVPLSHGCVRMRNADVVELFSTVHVGDKCYISELEITLGVVSKVMKYNNISEGVS